MPPVKNLLVLDDLNLTYLRGRSKFKVGQPFRLAWNYGDRHRRATIPVGSDTNGPSVPVAFQWLLPVINDGLIAAAFHDWAASTPGSGIGRAEADAVDREIKRRGNVARWRAWLAWAVVRALGWTKWHGAAESVNVGFEGFTTRLDPGREPEAGA